MMTNEPQNSHPFFIMLKSLALMLFFSIIFDSKFLIAEESYKDDMVSVKYFYGWTDEDFNILSAIRFKLSPGWKTYWKNPGPLGIRPLIDWSGSENIKSIKFLWPTPKVYDQSGLTMLGYDDILIIPIAIKKTQPQEEGVLRMKIEFGVCSDICVLKTVKIHSPLKLLGSLSNTEIIEKAIQKIPSKMTAKVINNIGCNIGVNNDEITLNYTIDLFKKPISRPYVIIDYSLSDEYVENQKMKIESKKLTISASLKTIYEQEGIIERTRLKALLIIDEEGFELNGCF